MICGTQDRKCRKTSFLDPTAQPGSREIKKKSGLPGRTGATRIVLQGRFPERLGLGQKCRNPGHVPSPRPPLPQTSAGPRAPAAFSHELRTRRLSGNAAPAGRRQRLAEGRPRSGLRFLPLPRSAGLTRAELAARVLRTFLFFVLLRFCQTSLNDFQSFCFLPNLI